MFNQVPVVLMTYNRPKHTFEVLKALNKEGVKKIIVYMDAPICSKDSDAQDEMTTFIKNIAWSEIQLIKRKTNLGLAKSITRAVTEQVELHNNIILLEDDCRPYPGFYNYMQNALNKYERNIKIKTVCAYQFPFICNSSCTITDIPLRRFIPWGWGTWRNRWEDYQGDLKQIVEEIKNKGKFQNLPLDLKNFCEDNYYLEQKADIWSINWVLAHYLDNSLSIFPSINLIDNIGFDGTGVHSVVTDDFNHNRSKIEKPKIKLNDNPSLNENYQKVIDDYLNIHSVKTMLKKSDHNIIQLI